MALKENEWNLLSGPTPRIMSADFAGTKVAEKRRTNWYFMVAAC